MRPSLRRIRPKNAPIVGDSCLVITLLLRPSIVRQVNERSAALVLTCCSFIETYSALENHSTLIFH